MSPDPCGMGTRLRLCPRPALKLGWVTRVRPAYSGLAGIGSQQTHMEVQRWMPLEHLFFVSHIHVLQQYLLAAGTRRATPLISCVINNVCTTITI